jgi:hypothetical protein
MFVIYRFLLLGLLDISASIVSGIAIIAILRLRSAIICCRLLRHSLIHQIKALLQSAYLIIVISNGYSFFCFCFYRYSHQKSQNENEQKIYGFLAYPYLFKKFCH